MLLHCKLNKGEITRFCEPVGRLSKRSEQFRAAQREVFAVVMTGSDLEPPDLISNALKHVFMLFTGSLCFASFAGYGTNTLSSMTKASLDPHSHLRQPGEFIISCADSAHRRSSSQAQIMCLVPPFVR